MGVGGTRQRGQCKQGGRRWADGRNYGIKAHGDSRRQQWSEMIRVDPMGFAG